MTKCIYCAEDYPSHEILQNACPFCRQCMEDAGETEDIWAEAEAKWSQEKKTEFADAT